MLGVSVGARVGTPVGASDEVLLNVGTVGCSVGAPLTESGGGSTSGSSSPVCPSSVMIWKAVANAPSHAVLFSANSTVSLNGPSTRSSVVSQRPPAPSGRTGPQPPSRSGFATWYASSMSALSKIEARPPRRQVVWVSLPVLRGSERRLFQRKLTTSM